MPEPLTRKLVPNEIIMQRVVEALDDGMEVVIRAKGYSMAPYVRHGKDSLVIHKPDIEKLRVGDFVLAKVPPHRYVAHRIIKADGNNLVLMGDGNLYGTESCKRSDVIGFVAFIERDDKRIDCNLPSERRKAAAMRTVYRLKVKARNLLGKIYHKIIRK